MISPLSTWFIGFFLPSLCGALTHMLSIPPIIRGVLVHVFVVISILVMFALGAHLELNFNIYNVALYVCAMGLCMIFLKKLSLAYILSVAIQEMCLLLAVGILYPENGIWAATIPVALMFFICHDFTYKELYWKPLLYYALVLFSFISYLYTQQPLIFGSIHLILGTILIQNKSLMRYRFD